VVQPAENGTCEVSGSHGGEYEVRVFWDILLCSQVDVDRRFNALMMEAVRTSETPVNIYLTTWQYIPEDSKLQEWNSLDLLIN
jgi:hypothetical protein